MKASLTSGLLFLALASLTAGPSRADDSTDLKPIGADTFAVTANRKAGAPLAGTSEEMGGGQWTAIGSIVFRPDGGITASESGHAVTAVIPLAGYDGSKTIRVSADVNATGSGHTALAFLSDVSPGDYWKNVELFVALNPNGNLEIYSNKVANKLYSGDASLYEFKPADYNHVELSYNPKTQTVSASVNGKQVAKDVAVVTPPAVIADVAIHFNEEIQANQPAVKNFQVSAVP